MCFGNTDISIRLSFRLAARPIAFVSRGKLATFGALRSLVAPGMSASVNTVVTEAWSVENYQQSGTVSARPQEVLRK